MSVENLDPYTIGVDKVVTYPQISNRWSTVLESAKNVSRYEGEFGGMFKQTLYQHLIRLQKELTIWLAESGLDELTARTVALVHDVGELGMEHDIKAFDKHGYEDEEEEYVAMSWLTEKEMVYWRDYEQVGKMIKGDMSLDHDPMPETLFVWALDKTDGNKGFHYMLRQYLRKSKPESRVLPSQKALTYTFDQYNLVVSRMPVLEQKYDEKTILLINNVFDYQLLYVKNIWQSENFVPNEIFSGIKSIAN